jgi:hypothetical protein
MTEKSVPLEAKALEAAPPAVKPLEWYPDPCAFPHPVWGAQSSFGRYTIEEVSASDSPAYEVRYTPHHLVAIEDGLESAKAAAQADYEQRIRSALTHPPVPQAGADLVERLGATIKNMGRDWRTGEEFFLVPHPQVADAIREALSLLQGQEHGK